MADRTWTVPCLDAAGRPRCVTVLAGEHDVVVRLPPGESATMTVRQADALRGYISIAVSVVLLDDMSAAV